MLCPSTHGWKMAPKKTWVFKKNLKNLKSPNLGFFYFLVKFYTNHTKFHILILTCEFCYVLHKCSEKERIVYRKFFLGVNFVSSHICTLKTKKPKKSKNFLKNLGFFQPWARHVAIFVESTAFSLDCAGMETRPLACFIDTTSPSMKNADCTVVDTHEQSLLMSHDSRNDMNTVHTVRAPYEYQRPMT